jgi:hypothetical protein
MERPSQPTQALTRRHHGPALRHPDSASCPTARKRLEDNSTGHGRKPAKFRYYGNPILGKLFQLLCWITSARAKTLSKLQHYRLPTHLQISSPSARYPLFALYPTQVTPGTLVPPYTPCLASLSARLSSESPPHSESPARLRPAFATLLLLTPHTGLPLYRYLGPPQTWSRTRAPARPGSTPPRGTHPSHGAPSPATSSRPSHGLSLTSPALPRPWSYQTWSRTRAPARPGSTSFVAPPLPTGIRLRPPAHVPPTDCAPA